MDLFDLADEQRMSSSEARRQEKSSRQKEILGWGKLYQERTILFVDETPRWNKAQQDALRPHVKSGMVRRMKRPRCK